MIKKYYFISREKSKVLKIDSLWIGFEQNSVSRIVPQFYFLH